MFLHPAGEGASINSCEPADRGNRGVGKPRSELLDCQARIIWHAGNMFVESVPNDVAHPLNAYQQLIDGIQAVLVSLLIEKVLDFPEGIVELVDLSLIQILDPKPPAQLAKAPFHGFHSFVEGIVDVWVLLELTDRLDEAVLQILQLLVGWPRRCSGVRVAATISFLSQT